MRLFGIAFKEITPLHWSAALTAFLIPCFRKFVALGIGLMLIAAIASAMTNNRKLSLRLNRSSWIMIAIFVLHFIGLNFAQNVDNGLKELEIKLSYFVFPLILFFGFEARRRMRYFIAACFVLGCLVRIPISLFDAWMIYSETGNIKAFSYEMLSEPYHPSYMALYQGASVLMLLGYLYNEPLNKKSQYVIGVLVVLILVYTSMLASRAGLVTAVLCIVMGGILYWKEATNRLERIFVSAGCLIVLLASSALLPATAQRIEALQIAPEIPTIAPKVQAPSSSSLALRQVTWSAAWNVLLKNPMGVGTSNTEKELVNEYVAMGESKAAEKRLNAHNQWLQLGAEFGWIGFVLMMALFASVIYAAYKQRMYIMMTIAGVFALNCLVESMLEVQAGIVFFAFLNLLIGPPVEVHRPEHAHL